MNFCNLRIIIRHIRKHLACRNCNVKYKSSNVYILEVKDSEITFMLKCPNCATLIFLRAVLNTRLRSNEITIYNPNQHISENDILDIHNFLNNFQGDFTSYMQ